MKPADPTLINQKRFVRLYKDTFVENSSMRLCFLLGPGASSSSGILTKTELAEQWLKQIEEDLEPQQIEQWKNSIGFSQENIEQHYSDIFSKRFQFDPELGRAIVQQQISNAEPGLGYMILARILEKTQHNLGISCTTDFLLEDALFSVASKPPFQYKQEEIDEETTLQNQRPLIIKLKQNRTLNNQSHNDNFEQDDNTDKHAEKWEPEFQRTLDTILKNFKMVVIGHNRNHLALQNYLKSSHDLIRQPIFWCAKNPEDVSSEITDALTEKDFLVEIESFDQLMFQMANSVDSKHAMQLDKLGKDYLLEIAEKKAQRYETLLQEFQDQEIGETLEDIEFEQKEMEINEDQFEDFLSSLQEPSREAEESSFKTAVDKHPTSAKHNFSYALFLEECNDYDKALNYYNQAAHLINNNEKINALYACFIAYHFQDYDTAEEYYQKALEINPKNAAVNILFGIFLHNIRRMFKAAESYFMAAYQATSSDIQYSDFMKEICKDYRISEILYKSSMEKELLKELGSTSQRPSNLVDLHVVKSA